MNTGTAVLLAMVLIAVVLLIVWLVLRSRSTSASATATGSSVPAGVGAAAAPDPAGPDEVEDTGAAALGSPGGDPSDGADLAEEYADPGLSELGDPPAPGTDRNGTVGDETDAVGGGETGVADADHQAVDESLAPTPRTPAEAFGDADGVGTAERASVSSGTSVLDEPDVDSTPLFRSIREERLAAAPDASADASVPVEPAQVVGEQPDLADNRAPEGDVDGDDADRSAAEPRSGVTDSDGTTVHVEDLDPAAPAPAAVPATKAATDEGAAATDEEDHDVPTDQETITPPTGQEKASDAASAAGEQPPVLRISELHEVVDGGFGIGSAAPIADGAQPLGHPIKANVDTKTYQDLHSPWYDTTEPDVWFLDAGFAERAGFHRAE
ncbi:MAG: hypothetical protein WCA30_02590 [Dermatophilaceae bacterium]